MATPGETAEEIAYRLYQDVWRTDGKFRFPDDGSGATDKPLPGRKYLLDLYAECLEAAKGRRGTR